MEIALTLGAGPVLTPLSVPLPHVPAAGLPMQKAPRHPSTVTLPQAGAVPAMLDMPPIGVDADIIIDVWPMFVGLWADIAWPRQNTLDVGDGPLMAVVPHTGVMPHWLERW